MSKRKTRKQKIKYQKRFSKKEELRKLKEKERKLQSEIDELKSQNIRNFHVKNLKIFGSVCNLVMPFVLTAGISTGLFKLISCGFPFVKDDITKYRKYSLESQLDGDIEMNESYETEYWYELEEEFINKLKVYYPYTKNTDSTYSRVVKEYSVDDHGKDLYSALLNKDVNYLDDTFSYDEEVEEISNIDNSNELSSDYVIEASLEFIDKKDKLYAEESDLRNNVVTIMELILTFGIGVWTTFKRDFSITESVEDIRYKYKKVSIEPAKEELKSTREKILTLTRGGDNLVK